MASPRGLTGSYAASPSASVAKLRFARIEPGVLIPADASFNENGPPHRGDPFSLNGVPKGIRTPVTAVKGRCPGPLDDGDTRTMFREEIGGARRDRTADLLHAMQALSQLSYSPTERGTIGSLAGAVKDGPVSDRLTRKSIACDPISHGPRARRQGPSAAASNTSCAVSALS